MSSTAVHRLLRPYMLSYTRIEDDGWVIRLIDVKMKPNSNWGGSYTEEVVQYVGLRLNVHRQHVRKKRGWFRGGGYELLDVVEGIYVMDIELPDMTLQTELVL
jgi:hypothetical protein